VMEFEDLTWTACAFVADDTWEYVVDYPAVVNESDWLLLVTGGNYYGGEDTPPAGWYRIRGTSYALQSVQLYARRANGTEGGTTVTTVSYLKGGHNAYWMWACIARYRRNGHGGLNSESRWPLSSSGGMSPSPVSAGPYTPAFAVAEGICGVVLGVTASPTGEPISAFTGPDWADRGYLDLWTGVDRVYYYDCLNEKGNTKGALSMILTSIDKVGYVASPFQLTTLTAGVSETPVTLNRWRFKEMPYHLHRGMTKDV